MMLGAVIYLLCAVTALACFALLWRAWRSTGAALLFWSGLCFAGLTVSNVLLVVDKLVFPTQVDLSGLRLGTSLAAVLLLLFGLIWGDDR
jgi:hypothetical protein